MAKSCIAVAMVIGLLSGLTVTQEKSRCARKGTDEVVGGARVGHETKLCVSCNDCPIACREVSCTTGFDLTEQCLLKWSGEPQWRQGPGGLDG
jgi:hypothetical protein